MNESSVPQKWKLVDVVPTLEEIGRLAVCFFNEPDEDELEVLWQDMKRVALAYRAAQPKQDGEAK